MGILVHECGRGFEFHIWQSKFWVFEFDVDFLWHFDFFEKYLWYLFSPWKDWLKKLELFCVFQ